MTAKRIPFVSYSGPRASFALSDDVYERLETAYETAIPDAARDALLATIERYLDSRRSELAWQSWKDVEGHFATIKRAVHPLWELVHKQLRSDAEVYLDSLFARHLANHNIPIDPIRGDLSIKTSDSEEWEPFQSRYTPPEGNYSVRFSTKTLHAIVWALAAATKKAEREIQAEIADKSVAPVKAVDLLILDLTNWAYAFELPRSAYVNGELPDKFSIFVCELLSLVPEELRERNLATAGAVAGHVKRVRNAAAKREREQKRKSLQA